MKPFIMFDVGANFGNASIPVAQAVPNAIVFGFEPTPQLFSFISEKIKYIENYTIFNCAVSNYNGYAEFNIAGQGDWGCSSLLPLSPNASIEWGDRTDMQVTERIQVPVIRLDSIMEEKQIQYIDYLHIDTQGSDLKVLDGLGKYIDVVGRAVMEAAAKPDVLYQNQNTLEESVQFLESHGFVIANIIANDEHGNEVNIHFKRI